MGEGGTKTGPLTYYWVRTGLLKTVQQAAAGCVRNRNVAVGGWGGWGQYVSKGERGCLPGPQWAGN